MEKQNRKDHKSKIFREVNHEDEDPEAQPSVQHDELTESKKAIIIEKAKTPDEDKVINTMLESKSPLKLDDDSIQNQNTAVITQIPNKRANKGGFFSCLKRKKQAVKDES